MKISIEEKKINTDYFLKEKGKKESLSIKVRLKGLSRLPAKKFLQLKNQSIKKLFCWNPQGLAFTGLEAGLSLLLFFLFLVLCMVFKLLLSSCFN